MKEQQELSMREQLRKRLDELLDRREAWERCELKFEDGEADNSKKIYSDIAAFAADVCGEGIVETSLWPRELPTDKRSALLLALYERLGQVTKLLAVENAVYKTRIREGDTALPVEMHFDVPYIRSALIALVRGDDPPLFERSPERIQKHYIAKLKLRALEWKACLRSKRFRSCKPFKMKAGNLEQLIAEAFDALEWKTVEAWKNPCKKVLGDLFVLDRLEAAKHGSIAGYEGEYSLESMRRDGQRLIEAEDRLIPSGDFS